MNAQKSQEDQQILDLIQQIQHTLNISSKNQHPCNSAILYVSDHQSDNEEQSKSAQSSQNTHNTHQNSILTQLQNQTKNQKIDPQLYKFDGFQRNKYVPKVQYQEKSQAKKALKKYTKTQQNQLYHHSQSQVFQVPKIYCCCYKEKCACSLIYIGDRCYVPLQIANKKNEKQKIKMEIQEKKQIIKQKKHKQIQSLKQDPNLQDEMNEEPKNKTKFQNQRQQKSEKNTSSIIGLNIQSKNRENTEIQVQPPGYSMPSQNKQFYQNSNFYTKTINPIFHNAIQGIGYPQSSYYFGQPINIYQTHHYKDSYENQSNWNKHYQKHYQNSYKEPNFNKLHKNHSQKYFQKYNQQYQDRYQDRYQPRKKFYKRNYQYNDSFKKQNFKNNQRYQSNKFEKGFLGAQDFTHFGVRVKLRLGSFLKLYKKDVLVVPYSTLSLEQNPARFISLKLNFNICSLLKGLKQQEKIRPGDVYASSSQGLEKYSAIYWVLAPNSYEQTSKFSASMLKKGISSIFEYVKQHKVQNIVFPSFICWPSLEPQETSRILLESIMSNISKSKCKHNLKEVTIILNEKKDYMEYVHNLRNIKDRYVEINLGGHIV